MEIKDDTLALNRTCQDIRINSLKIKGRVPGRRDKRAGDGPMNKTSKLAAVNFADQLMPKIIPIDEKIAETKGPSV